MKQIKCKANITATGKYLPEKVLTNHDMEKLVETSDEWIQTRTGIRERRIVQNGQATVDMSTKAVRDLIEKIDLNPKEIDAIIVATITPDMVLPCSAALIQKNINAINAWGYDLSAACSGFLFGLESGAALIESERCKKVIVIGADTMSSILNYKDRNTCILFGDGAGAIVLGKQKKNKKSRIISTELYSDGRLYNLLYVDGGVSLNQKAGYLKMNGKEVFKHAITKLVKIVKLNLKKNNLKINDIDWIIPHQANKRIMVSTAKKLKIPFNKVLMTIEKHANTSSASIPLTLDFAISKKIIKRNQLILFEAIGGGLTWGCSLLKF